MAVTRESRITRVLLAIVAALATLCIALAVWIVRSRTVRLEELSIGERLALVEQARLAAPPVFRAFPFSGTPGFYHMAPNTTYENVYGATFSTDALGFRAPAMRPAGSRRLVIAGDSWTFGPFVPPEHTWGAALEQLLNRGGERWQVYSLSMMGWNADNMLAALNELMPVLAPDLVVLCPTPNDIDDAFAVWEGRLVTQGFTSSALFRDSFLTESRWVATLRKLDVEMERLASRGVPTLAYFLADWEGLPPYYAKLAGFRPRYVVQPRDTLEGRFRLPGSVDPGEHPTVEGHARISAYLLNALVQAGLVRAEPVPLEWDVAFPGHEYDPQAAAAALDRARDNVVRFVGSNLYPVDPELMLEVGLYSVAIPPDRDGVRIRLQPLPEPWLYPLDVEIVLEAPEPVVERVRLERFTDPGPQVELRRPAALREHDFVDVRLRASRTVLHPLRGIPVSMRHPIIEPAPD